MRIALVSLRDYRQRLADGDRIQYLSSAQISDLVEVMIQCLAGFADFGVKRLRVYGGAFRRFHRRFLESRKVIYADDYGKLALPGVRPVFQDRRAARD